MSDASFAELASACNRYAVQLCLANYSDGRMQGIFTTRNENVVKNVH